MNGSRSLLKQDVRGRVKTPAPRREALLDEFERSGVSGAKFATMVGVKYQTFAAWVIARRKSCALEPQAISVAAPASLRLVEAVLATDNKTPDHVSARVMPALNVHLQNGVRIEISDASQVNL